MWKQLRVLSLAFITSCSVCFAALSVCAGQTSDEPRLLAPVPDAENAPAESKERPAALVVFNREIVSFRGNFLGASPVDRVRLADRRLHELLERGGPGAVSVEDLPQGSILKVDGVFFFLIAPVDLSGGPEDSTRREAERAATVLRRVIAETREARDGRHMLVATGEVVAATLLYVLLLWVLFRLRRQLQRRLLILAQRQAQRLSARSVAVLVRENAATALGWFLSAVLTGLVLLLSYEWTSFALSRFPFTRPWSEQLDIFFVDLGLEIVTGIVGALPGLVVVLIIFWLARFAVRAFHSLFDRIQSGQFTLGWLDPDNVRPTRRIVAIGIWLFALVMAYPYLPGADTEAFKGISVLVGLMVSMGGSGLVAHAGSGLILMYTRALRVGEYVRVGEHEGTVTELGTFTTRIRTGLGEEIVLPNASVIGAAIKNYSRTVQGDGFILDTTVTIGYDTPWRQVEAMLLEAAAHTEGILKTPAPRVFQLALSDFYVEYRLVTQAIPTAPRYRAELLTVLHQNVQDRFNEYGVQIMSPHYVLDPKEAKLVQRSQWYAAPAVDPKDERAPEADHSASK